MNKDSVEFVTLIRERLANTARYFSEKYPELATSSGENTAQKGQLTVMWVSVTLKQVLSRSPALIELVVELCDCAEATLLSADVIWGDGDGRVEASFREAPVPCTHHVQRDLLDDLPRLQRRLEDAVRRGCPPQ
jgi:hypothetical protein